jgi:hypothetical protein
MQFKVPQDVQREDTIIGSLTLRQMAILGIGGGVAYAIYISLSKAYFLEIWLPPVAIIVILTLALAFVKVHNIPFLEYIMHAIEYLVLNKKRSWIQGTGNPFIPPFENNKNKKKMDKNQKKMDKNKNQKSLEELTQVLDSHGKSELTK